MRFSLGVNYWPGRSAFAMWRDFDAGVVAEDFARIAALGLDTVRFFLRWDDFQPQADRIEPLMLDRLQELVGLASDAGLGVVPTLFCGSMAGEAFLPAWLRGSLYRGAALDAQLLQARAVGERLRAHPAVRAWDIGHAFSKVSRPDRGKVFAGEHGRDPASEREVAEWSRRLAAALRDASQVDAVTAGTFAGDLLEDRDVRLGSLCAPFAFASMQGSPVTSFFARDRRDPEVVPFLAMLAAAFSFKPVMVTGLGNPTCPPHKFSPYERFDDPAAVDVASNDPVFATYPCLSDEENAAYCTAALERLHADGRLGAFWWCWSDYADTVDVPPHERTQGVLRADGSEKPIAAALAAFAAERRDVVPARDMPMISATYYYRTLPTSAHTLYEAFLGFVRERRG